MLPVENIYEMLAALSLSDRSSGSRIIENLDECVYIGKRPLEIAVAATVVFTGQKSGRS